MIVTEVETGSYFLHLDKNQFPQKNESRAKENGGGKEIELH